MRDCQVAEDGFYPLPNIEILPLPPLSRSIVHHTWRTSPTELEAEANNLPHPIRQIKYQLGRPNAQFKLIAFALDYTTIFGDHLGYNVSSGNTYLLYDPKLKMAVEYEGESDVNLVLNVEWEAVPKMMAERDAESEANDVWVWFGKGGCVEIDNLLEFRGEEYFERMEGVDDGEVDWTGERDEEFEVAIRVFWRL